MFNAIHSSYYDQDLDSGKFIALFPVDNFIIIN